MRSYVKQNGNLETLQPQTRIFPGMASVSQATISEGEIFIVENVGMYIRISGSNVLIFAAAPSAGVIGEIRAYCSSTPPTNDWIICDGSTFDTTLCPDLYTLLGDNHVPDLREYTTKMGSNIGQFDESAIGPHTHRVVVEHDHYVSYSSEHNVSNYTGSMSYVTTGSGYPRTLSNEGTVSPAFITANNQYNTSSTYSYTSYNGQFENYIYNRWGSGSGYDSYYVGGDNNYQYTYPSLTKQTYLGPTGSGWLNIRFGTTPFSNGFENRWPDDHPLSDLIDGTFDNWWYVYSFSGSMGNSQLDVSLTNTGLDDVNAESGTGVYYIIRAK